MHVFDRSTAPMFFQAHLDNTSRELTISVSIQDRTLRDKVGAGFDGMERPFAYMPNPANGGVFEKKYLSFVGTTPASGPRPDSDHFKLVLKAGEFDLAAAMLHGIAVGLDTNVGEVWMQAPGDDHKVT
ncbi:MAG: hypothetical protein IT381_20285 [Deltaproteobacteria bacterium]|nr:hypothetical protein [Deltaproteobacteria bacterium]